VNLLAAIKTRTGKVLGLCRRRKRQATPTFTSGVTAAAWPVGSIGRVRARSTSPRCAPSRASTSSVAVPMSAPSSPAATRACDSALAVEVSGDTITDERVSSGAKRVTTVDSVTHPATCSPVHSSVQLAVSQRASSSRLPPPAPTSSSKAPPCVGDEHDALDDAVGGGRPVRRGFARGARA
jgi:hypothetical protein